VPHAAGRDRPERGCTRTGVLVGREAQRVLPIPPPPGDMECNRAGSL